MTEVNSYIVNIEGLLGNNHNSGYIGKQVDILISKN